MTLDEIKKIAESLRATGANVELVGVDDDDCAIQPTMRHRLSAEAQEANLVSMWAEYSKDKMFKAGDILREAPGMTTFSDNPVLLFVRYLDLDGGADSVHDRMLLREFLVHRPGYGRIDCIVARTTDAGTSMFVAHSSRQLIPYVPE